MSTATAPNPRHSALAEALAQGVPSPDRARVLGHHVAAAPDIKLLPFSPVPPRVLLIGCSTGGPQALTALLPHLRSVIDTAPVLIVQHMLPTFTAIMAEHLAQVTGRPVHEGQDGEAVRAGNVYIAPAQSHMTVTRQDGAAIIALNDNPPINFCKPAIDPLFSSAATIWGSWNLALVLTGMGFDGRAGAEDVVKRGGNIIAQDEASSVVWGMPGTVARSGLCSAVLPLDEIAPKVVSLFGGCRS